VLASGVMGISYSGMLQAVKHGAGMVTTKSFTLEPRKGHEGPVVAEFDGGFINSMGLSNPGLREGLKEVDDFKMHSDAPLIVSIFAIEKAGFLSLIEMTNSSRADFVELNLSCPNVADEFGVPLAASKESVYEIVHAVKQFSKLPVIAKLSPNTYNVEEIALSAEKAGADALTLINTLGPGMLIDITAKKPVIKNKIGGVSGPAIKPIAIKLIYEISAKLQIPIIGTGGVLNGEDAIEFLMAGAAMVGIGTAVYYRGIEAFAKVNAEMIAYMEANGISSIDEIKRI
jgi:dihydroorotate dehydrogenase (NAD+) catalytic subunit